jgi:hypothetical protein
MRACQVFLDRPDFGVTRAMVAYQDFRELLECQEFVESRENSAHQDSQAPRVTVAATDFPAFQELKVTLDVADYRACLDPRAPTDPKDHLAQPDFQDLPVPEVTVDSPDFQERRVSSLIMKLAQLFF